jgi:hypothetical protein
MQHNGIEHASTQRQCCWRISDVCWQQHCCDRTVGWAAVACCPVPCLTMCWGFTVRRAFQLMRLLGAEKVKGRQASWGVFTSAGQHSTACNMTQHAACHRLTSRMHVRCSGGDALPACCCLLRCCLLLPLAVLGVSGV